MLFRSLQRSESIVEPVKMPCRQDNSLRVGLLDELVCFSGVESDGLLYQNVLSCLDEGRRYFEMGRGWCANVNG